MNTSLPFLSFRPGVVFENTLDRYRATDSHKRYSIDTGLSRFCTDRTQLHLSISTVAVAQTKTTCLSVLQLSRGCLFLRSTRITISTLHVLNPSIWIIRPGMSSSQPPLLPNEQEKKNQSADSQGEMADR